MNQEKDLSLLSIKQLDFMIMKSKNQGGITMKNNKGLTLLELIIAIAIVFILVAIAVPSYIGQQKRAARTEAFTNLAALRLLEEQSFSENAAYAPMGSLTGFNPGPGANFTYAITNNNNVGLPTPVPFPYDGSTAALGNPNTSCFIATATGIAGTRVAGDTF